MADIHAQVLANTGQALPTLDVYPGSIKRPCFRCDKEVWVGPRQQTILEVSPSVATACMICAMQAAAEAQEAVTVAQLGNPYRTAHGQPPTASSTSAPEGRGKH